MFIVLSKSGEADCPAHTCCLPTIFTDCTQTTCYKIKLLSKSKTSTVVPTKSDSDVYFVFTIAKYNTILYTSLELTRIEIWLVY